MKLFSSKAWTNVGTWLLLIETKRRLLFVTLSIFRKITFSFNQTWIKRLHNAMPEFQCIIFPKLLAVWRLWPITRVPNDKLVVTCDFKWCCSTPKKSFASRCLHTPEVDCRISCHRCHFYFQNRRPVPMCWPSQSVL